MNYKLPQKWKDFLSGFLKKEKLILILLFGVLLIIINIPTKSSKSGKNTAESPAETLAVSDYITELENELEKILSETENVGNCRVAISVKNSGRSVLHSQKNTTTNTSKQQDGQDKIQTSEIKEEEESIVYQKNNSDSTPFVAEEEMPEILGVIVIATGADDAKVVSDITGAASALLGIPVNKIKVLKMEV